MPAVNVLHVLAEAKQRIANAKTKPRLSVPNLLNQNHVPRAVVENALVNKSPRRQKGVITALHVLVAAKLQNANAKKVRSSVQSWPQKPRTMTAVIALPAPPAVKPRNANAKNPKKLLKLQKNPSNDRLSRFTNPLRQPN